MCNADAPQFQSWRIFRANLFDPLCGGHAGGLRRQAFHLQIVVNLTFINIVFSVAERRPERRVCSRQRDFRPASQFWMDWLCAVTSLVRHLPVLLAERAANHLVGESRREFAFAQRQVDAIHHRRQDHLLRRTLE